MCAIIIGKVYVRWARTTHLSGKCSIELGLNSTCGGCICRCGVEGICTCGGCTYGGRTYMWRVWVRVQVVSQVVSQLEPVGTYDTWQQQNRRLTQNRCLT